MALITGTIVAQARTATAVIEYLFPGWPAIVLQPLGLASSLSLDDPYPILTGNLVTPLDVVAADSVGNPGDGLGAPNRIAKVMRQRTETLKNYVNVLIRLANLLTENFLDRDGIRVGSEIADTAYMRGNLDLGSNRIINMAPATDANDLVNYDQFKDTLFAYEDVLDFRNQAVLRRDGANAMANPLDMGVGLPGRRVINLGVPTQPSHAVTKTYQDTEVQAFTTGYLARTGFLTMQNAGQAWSMGQNGIINLATPTIDSDAASKSWVDDRLGDTTQGAVPIGTVVPHFGTTIPDGFLQCDGREVARDDYQSLFAIIGIAYGTPSTGDTFVLPDLRGRVLIGQDNLGGTLAGRVTASWALQLGGTGGAQTHVLSLGEMAGHSHSYDDKYFADGSGGAFEGVAAADADASLLRNVSSSTDSQGQGQAHNNMQPSMAVRWIIRSG